MYLFASIVLTVLAALWTYIGLSLVFPLVYGTPWMWLGLLFLLVTYSLQVWRWLAYGKSDEKPKRLHAAYFSMGLMVYMMVVAIPKDIAGLFIEIPDFINLPLMIIALILNSLSMYVAHLGPAVRTVEIKTGLSGKPIHIVQISDLHIGPIIQTTYVRKVVEKIKELKPDLIVATGDIGDGQVSFLEVPLKALGEVTKGCPSFYIPGNHEYYWNIDHWLTTMQGLGFKTLVNQGQLFDLPGKIPLWIGGVPDLQAGRFRPDHASNPAKAISLNEAQDHYKVLLAHHPQTCLQAEKAGFDLMLCGHTHGGQFFPITLLVGFFNIYTRGLNFHGKLKVYVNVGTGFWGPPLRLGERAEITSLRLS